MLIFAFFLVVFWQQDVVLTDVSVRSYNFTDKDIRLVGGNSELEGRVEIRINGTWGTICYRWWFDFSEADVLCRMLHANLSALEYYTDSRYAHGTGPIFYLSCSGTEQTIQNCSNYKTIYCSHSSDVGLMCTGCSRTALHTYGLFEHVNITIDGDLYTGNCSNGTSIFQFMYRCALNGSWEKYGPACGPLDVRDVRFVGGVGPYDGGVEVLVGDTWGPVCGYSHGNSRSYYSDGSVFCKMKGKGYVAHSSTWRYNTTNGFIGHVNCPSNADHVNSCNYTTVYTCGYQLVVSCEGFPLNISSIQLVDGSSTFDGRIELRVEDRDGIICPNKFSFEDAQVLCKMIGLNASLFNVDYQYNTSGRYSMIRDLQCSGQEYHINNCTYISPSSFIYACEKGAVTLFCTECGRLNPAYGLMELYNETTKTLTVRCHNDRPTHVQYTCGNNGSWSYTEECMPVVIQAIRLVNQNQLYIYRGTVELKINDAWGTICGNMFGVEEATVLCRMMNASYAAFTTNAHDGRGSGKVHMANVLCSGSEKDVSECMYQSSHTCTHSDDVGVRCQGRPLVIQDIRLANGNSITDGRVEIKVFDTWGTVCYDGFGMKEAMVICKMMGFNHAVGFRTSVYAGTGPIFIDEMACGYNSSHINDCQYVTDHNCNHWFDISVTCSGTRIVL